VLRILDSLGKDGCATEDFQGSTSVVDSLAAKFTPLNSKKAAPFQSVPTSSSPNSKRQFLVSFVEYIGSLPGRSRTVGDTKPAACSTDDMLPLLIISIVSSPRKIIAAKHCVFV